MPSSTLHQWDMNLWQAGPLPEAVLHTPRLQSHLQFKTEVPPPRTNTLPMPQETQVPKAWREAKKTQRQKQS